MDLNTKTFLLIERNINGALAVYKQIYDKEKKQTKQSTMDIFLKSDTSFRRALGRSSGGILEEGSVILDGDSSIHGMALKTFQRDKIWRQKMVMWMSLALCGPRLICVHLCVSQIQQKHLKRKNVFNLKIEKCLENKDIIKETIFVQLDKVVFVLSYMLLQKS